MRAVEASVKADHCEPASYQACVLSRGQMACRTASRKEIWNRSITPLREIVVDRLAGLLRDLEANRPSCFSLANGGSINGMTIGCDVNNL